MSPVALPIISIVSAVFLMTAEADGVAPPAPNAGGAMLMPLAGVPDSQVYVFPMTAGPSPVIGAALEQIRGFAALFHTADPRIHRDFENRWAKIQEEWTALEKVRTSGLPADTK